MQFKSKCLIAGLAIHVGWVETTVETQHLSVVCWVLLSSNPTYDYHQVIDFAFLTHPTIYYFIENRLKTISLLILAIAFLILIFLLPITHFRHNCPFQIRSS